MKKVFNVLKNINITYLYFIIILLFISTITSILLFCNKKTIVKKITVPVTSNEIKKEVKTIKIDIKGNVNNPGVYELPEDSRVIDAINISGGLKENSNTELINLAQKLTDEMIIIVYTNKEIEQYRKSKKIDEIVYVEVDKCPDNVNDACINKTNSSHTKDKNTSDSNMISINTASVEELQKLSGVGESKAKSIVEYREANGNFNSIDDIKNVSGIGESLFEKIKNNITI